MKSACRQRGARTLSKGLKVNGLRFLSKIICSKPGASASNVQN